MTSIKIYHNPRCSKSREALALLQEKGLKPIVINYLQTKLSLYTLQKIQRMLDIPAMDMLRNNEAEFEHIDILTDPDTDSILNVILEYPKLLQRPIVVCQNRAIIARPANKLLELLNE